MIKKLEIDKLPHSKILIKVAKSGGKIGDAFGVLVKKNTNKISLSIKEIDTLSREAWAGNK